MTGRISSRSIRTGAPALLLSLSGLLALPATAHADPASAEPRDIEPTSTAATGADRSRALLHGPEGAEAAARILADFYRRQDGEGGFAWWMGLPISVRSRHAVIPDVRHWRYRVEFLRDAARGDAAACRFSGAAVLRDTELRCDRVDEVQRYLDCVEAVDSPLRAMPGLSFAELRTQVEADTQRCPKRTAQVEALLDRMSGLELDREPADP